MTDGPTTPTPPPGGMPGAPAPSFIDRAKNILFSPKTEWPRIDAEPATVGGIFTSYAVILAAIGPVAGLIGQALVGVPMGYAITNALITYLVSLAVVFLVSLIVDALATTFGGTKNQVQATKLVVYSATPGWVVGVLAILPPLLPLMVLLSFIALAYGIYLFYLGVPQLMKVPQDKVVGYVVVTAVSWVVVSWVLLLLLAGIVLSTLGFGVMSAVPRY